MPAKPNTKSPSVSPQKKFDITDTKAAKENISDLGTWGNADTFKLVCKAWSNSGGWMKSTKALHIPQVGCVIQVSTQQRNPDGTYSLAESSCFAPGVRLLEHKDETGRVVSRTLQHSA